MPLPSLIKRIITSSGENHLFSRVGRGTGTAPVCVCKPRVPGAPESRAGKERPSLARPAPAPAPAPPAGERAPPRSRRPPACAPQPRPGVRMRPGPPPSRSAGRLPGARARAPLPFQPIPPPPTDLLYCLQTQAAHLAPGDPSPCSGFPDVPSGPSFHPGGARRPRAPRSPGPARARPPPETASARAPGPPPPARVRPGLAPPPPPPPPPRARSSSKGGKKKGGKIESGGGCSSDPPPDWARPGGGCASRRSRAPAAASQGGPCSKKKVAAAAAAQGRRPEGRVQRAGGRAGWGRPRGVPEPRAARSRRAGGGGGGGGGCSGCRSGGGCGGGISSSHDPTVCPRDQRERLPYLLRPLLPRGVSAGLRAPPAARPLPSLPPLPSPPPPPRPPRPRPPHGHAGPGSGSRCLGYRCCRRQVRSPAWPCPRAPAPAPRPAGRGRHDPERPRARLKMEAAEAGGDPASPAPRPRPRQRPRPQAQPGGTGALQLGTGAGARAALIPLPPVPPAATTRDPRRRRVSSCRKVSVCGAGRARGGLGAPGAAVIVPRPSSAPGGDGPGAEEQTAVAITSVQQAAFGDHNIQYQFRTETNGGQVSCGPRGRASEQAGGRARREGSDLAPAPASPLCRPLQVTYRVVQVTDGQLDGQGDTTGAVSVVSTAAFAGGQQAVTQVGVDGAAQRPGPAAASVPPGPAAPFPLAVIQNPFSNGGSPAAEAVSGEARFAYFPASSVGDTTAVSVQTTDQSLQAGGQFYVMMTPQDVLQTGTQRTIAPRTHPYSPKIDGTRTPRDERRRAQHNEVERRRRDKINNWIVQLSKIIPDCNADNSKTGASKGGILSKACDYIRELRQTNQRMQETFKEAERLQMDNELLRQQIEELKNENALLRAQLQQHNLEMVGESTRQ
uniref:Upstream stimulatory factor 2 n=3 Tax=Euarchontoglires TaxID=314146 RepID=A0A5F7ZFD1_MACMU